MAYENVLDDLKKCINLEVPSQIPCFPLGLESDVNKAGVTHRQFRTDPETMVKVGKETIEKFGYDWFILFPDDLIEYEKTGIQITDEEHIPPAVRQYLPATEESLEKLRLPDPQKDGRMPLHLAGLAALKKELGNSVIICGRIAAPFGGVTLLLGVEATLILMLKNPNLLKKFMKYINACNEIWAQAQIEAGADVLWLGDCVATSRFISPDQYRQYAADYAEISSQLVQKYGGIVIYHGAEISLEHLQIMADLSVNIINIGEDVDISKVKQAIGHKKCIMGNLDPINILQNGTVSDVKEAVGNILTKAGNDGGYIFCTGEGIPRNVPEENIQAMVQTVKSFSIIPQKQHWT